MRREIKNFIFLTRHEITIHGKFFLTVHLPPGCSRQEALDRHRTGKNLHLVVYDPVMRHPSSIMSKSWYLIPGVRYSGRAANRNLIHTSFSYDYGNALDGVRTRALTRTEVDFMREHNYLEI